MAASKIKQVEKHIDTSVPNIGTTVQEKGQYNAQSTEMRITLRCPKGLVSRLDKMRKGKAGRVSRNQAIIEILDARLPT